MRGIPGFSATSIDRMISHANSLKRERNRDALISKQINLEKELPPVYELVDMQFDVENRLAKLFFTQTKKYRTIDRYVTKDYVRYPVYSDWKEKTKKITKNIKLTNSILEDLIINEDELIRDFAIEIVNNINNIELCPSWYKSEALKLEEKEKVNKILQDISTVNDNSKTECSILEEKIIDNNNEIENKNKLLTKLTKKNKVIEKKILKYQEIPNVFLLIVTFGIIKCLYSSKHVNKLSTKNETILLNIGVINNEINALTGKNKNLNVKISENKFNAKHHEKEQRKIILDLASDLSYNLSRIEPLPTVPVISDEEFVPLKVFIGYDYHKIIGCYIIHNINNDRCYVGQSKDVIRRLHQHFNGTAPKNIIFAEDYYSYQGEKENLFEVKIIPCETKDELDRLEKSLIDQYDALTEGYNRTSGNN